MTPLLGQELCHSRPWKTYQDCKDSRRMPVSKGRNYNVYADVGLDCICIHRLENTLETGAGPNFVIESELSTGFETKLSTGPLSNIDKASKNPLLILPIIKFQVHFHVKLTLKIIVCETLAASVIIGTHSCVQHVKAIRLKTGPVELNSGDCNPFIRKAREEMKSQPPLPDGLT